MTWLSQNVARLGELAGMWLALGLISLVLTVITLPLIVLRLPADYFRRDKRQSVARDSRHPVIVWLVNLTKNLLGIVLIIFGAVMLFVPGQGVLTMLIGILLTNFPGKFRLEQKIVRRPAVLRTLNRIRARGGRTPLLPPEDELAA